MIMDVENAKILKKEYYTLFQVKVGMRPQLTICSVSLLSTMSNILLML